MGTVTKDQTFINSSAGTGINFDYNMTVGVVLNDLVNTSQTAFMVDAMDTLDNAGYAIGYPAPQPWGKDTGGGGENLEIVDIRVTPLNAESARAAITFGTPAVPATTWEDESPVWIWELSSSVRAEQQAWDVGTQAPGATVGTNPKAIRCAYYPHADATTWYNKTEWDKPDNQRRWNQTHTAQRYRPWQTATARCRIHESWIQINGGYAGPDAMYPAAARLYNPRTWASNLTGYVNDTLDRESLANPDPNLTKGIWMCQGVQVSTPNNGIIWDVRVTFARNDFGWDQVILYTDPNNQNKIPADVAANMDNQASFKLPYPDDGQRVLQMTGLGGACPEPTAGGGVRPKMHLLKNFNSEPWKLNLLKVM